MIGVVSLPDALWLLIADHCEQPRGLAAACRRLWQLLAPAYPGRSPPGDTCRRLTGVWRPGLSLVALRRLVWVDLRGSDARGWTASFSALLGADGPPTLERCRLVFRASGLDDAALVVPLASPATNHGGSLRDVELDLSDNRLTCRGLAALLRGWSATVGWPQRLEAWGLDVTGNALRATADECGAEATAAALWDWPAAARVRVRCGRQPGLGVASWWMGAGRKARLGNCRRLEWQAVHVGDGVTAAAVAVTLRAAAPRLTDLRLDLRGNVGGSLAGLAARLREVLRTASLVSFGLAADEPAAACGLPTLLDAQAATLTSVELHGAGAWIPGTLPAGVRSAARGWPLSPGVPIAPAGCRVLTVDLRSRPATYTLDLDDPAADLGGVLRTLPVGLQGWTVRATGARWGLAGARALAAAVAGAAALTVVRLDLSGTEACGGDRGLACLAGTVFAPPRVEVYLRLVACGLTWTATACLGARACPMGAPTLRRLYLDLRENPTLGDRGVIALTELRTGTTLNGPRGLDILGLRLAGCGLGNVGGHAAAVLLWRPDGGGPRRVDLDLSRNSIGSDGAEALLRVLRPGWRRPTLRHATVDLSFNPSGAHVMAAAGSELMASAAIAGVSLDLYPRPSS